MKSHNKPSIKKFNFKVDEITLVLIVIALAFILSVYEKSNDSKQFDAEKITELILDDHDISFVNNGIVDENKLKEMQKTDYVTLKNQFNTKNDFCIYIEDADGKVIVAKGSSKLSKDIAHCRE